MPQLIVVAAAGIASWVATLLAVKLDIAAPGSLLATGFGVVAGAVVAVAGAAILSTWSV